MDTNENIVDKLKYLGLDLSSIPERFKAFEPLEYRPSKYDDEHTYKIYKYVDVQDIEILLTKANRLQSISEKYGKALPLYAYLDEENEENLEKHTKFLSMLSNMDIDKIEELEKEQICLNKEIPFKVKYQKDYLWQIYYSEYTNKYFMLVPTEDLEYSAFFYILKKQLQNKNEKIFVPISYMDYTREYLTKTQISDIENYLWLFTKEWPLVYEVYDKDEKLSIHIVGKANVYDDIKSDYKIVLKDNEEALKFYKLLKALFIMQTEIPHHFDFNVSIDEKGSLEFNNGDKKIIYEILPSFIKEEYVKADTKKVETLESKAEHERILNDLQKESEKLEKEFLDKERQITTFLECKKTFFGRVRYFIKYKKVSLVKQTQKEEKKQEVKVIRLNKYGEVKSNYTLEELIDVYKQVDTEEIKERNLKSDIKAIEQRIVNLENKVKNASQYIEEIDKHKKSIFEFWKFTNKDKQDELPEGNIQEENVEKLKKAFDYELDFEDLGASLDKKQRELLSKQELDSIFLTSTYILKDINDVLNEKEINNDRLEELKDKAVNEKDLLDKESFDIFSGMSYDNKLNTLANQKHREAPKEIFSILPITKYTTKEEFVEMIKEVIKNLDSSFEKIQIGINIPVYKCLSDDIKKQYNVFNIQATNALKEFEDLEKSTIDLYKINLQEDTNICAFTNSAFYENNNKTLPVGMNVKEDVLLNNKEIKIRKIKEKQVNLVCYENEKYEFSKIIVKKINVKEYEIIK